MTAMILALVAVGCDGRPARDPSARTTTTSSSSESYGKPASATVYSTKIDAASRPATRGSAAAASAQGDARDVTSGARAIEEQRPDGSMSTRDGSGNTRWGTVADPNAKPVGNESRASQEQTKDSNDKSAQQDRPGGAVGVGDQGNSSSETKITADIRKQLVVSDSLSFSAKNIKVITTGSRVTLRGTVKSDREKAEIEGIAKATNGVTEVDNRLDVQR